MARGSTLLNAGEDRRECAPGNRPRGDGLTLDGVRQVEGKHSESTKRGGTKGLQKKAREEFLRIVKGSSPREGARSLDIPRVDGARLKEARGGCGSRAQFVRGGGTQARQCRGR